MTSLRCADCGEPFREEDHPQCWRETTERDSDGSPVEVPVCRQWLERHSIGRQYQDLT